MQRNTPPACRVCGKPPARRDDRFPMRFRGMCFKCDRAHWRALRGLAGTAPAVNTATQNEEAAAKAARMQHETEANP